MTTRGCSAALRPNIPMDNATTKVISSHSLLSANNYVSLWSSDVVLYTVAEVTSAVKMPVVSRCPLRPRLQGQFT
jgi:hypothetical protein